MKDEQGIIVDWMRVQLDRQGISAAVWAKRGGLSPTTVTRAMSDDYPAVSSVPTLVALAKAAGLPTSLDFLASQSAGASMPGASRQVLSAVLTEVGCTGHGGQDLISEAMIEALTTVSRASSDAQNDHLFVQSVARAAVARVGIPVR